MSNLRKLRRSRPFRRAPRYVGEVVPIPQMPVFHAEEAHFTTPLPIVCKWCGSKDVMKHGKRGGIQYYLCVKCGKMHFMIDQIGTALTMFYEGEQAPVLGTCTNKQENHGCGMLCYETWVTLSGRMGLVKDSIARRGGHPFGE